MWTVVRPALQPHTDGHKVVQCNCARIIHNLFQKMVTTHNRVLTVLRYCDLSCGFLRRLARPNDRVLATLRHCDLSCNLLRRTACGTGIFCCH